METYGEQIIRLRKDRGMTQQELADAAGLAKRTIQAVEADESATVQRRTRLALNRVLAVEGDPVMERESWPPEVSVFTDLAGAYLANLPEGKRLAIVRALTRELFGRQPG